GALRVSLLEVDEADLGARLARVGVYALELLELQQGVVELLLADVQATEPPAHEHALGVERQDALVELDRLVVAPLELVGERQVGQDELRLRVQLEGVEIVALRLVELAAGGVDAPEVVVAEDRPRVARDELLQDPDCAVRLAALAVEG